ICEEQERCFDLAEIEYFLETNREQQAIEGAHAFLIQSGNITEPNQLMSMAGIMCKLYRKGLNDVLYENIIQFLMKELKEQPGEQMSRNAEGAVFIMKRGAVHGRGLPAGCNMRRR
ncbi:MAG: hypothetical protein V8R80_04010, partial [Eubacterium sp.]